MTTPPNPELTPAILDACIAQARRERAAALAEIWRALVRRVMGHGHDATLPGPGTPANC